MTGREYLEPIPAATDRLRHVADQPVTLFDDLTVDELTVAARWLHAASFQALNGARHLEHVIRNRQEP